MTAKTTIQAIATFFLITGILMPALSAFGQTRENGPWWPHPLWGPGDEAGGSNWITPEKILEAVSLVQSGEVHELGHTYEHDMPFVGQRSYNIFIPSFPTTGPVGDNRLVFNDEYITSEIGQVGTQFDGPGHVGKEVDMADGTTKNVFYNGTQGHEMKNPYGLLRNGVEKVRPYITRGILIDIAGYKGTEIVASSYEVTMDDVRGALDDQGISVSDIKPGDALLFNFGWWHYWPDQIIVDGNKPYIGREVINWVIEMQASMVGSDTGMDDDRLTLHEELVLKNGIFNLEFMTFETLLEADDYEFLFLCTPLKLKGATGSPVRPLAIL